MKLPANIKPCVTKNMPIWGRRFEKAKSTQELHSIQLRRKGETGELRTFGAMGDYSTCVVGEFWGFRKKDERVIGAYDGCGVCYQYSMDFHRAESLKEFATDFKEFCKHAKEIHGKRFK